MCHHNINIRLISQLGKNQVNKPILLFLEFLKTYLFWIPSSLMDEESMMEMWMNQSPTFGEVSPDYGEIKDYQESNHYVTSHLSNEESESLDDGHSFHGQDLYLIMVLLL